MKLKYAILLTLLCAPGNKSAFSQSKKADSLWHVLKTAKEDTVKVNNLIALFAEFRYSDTDTALYLANSALSLATKLNYQMGIADSKRGISAVYASQGKFAEGLIYGNDALTKYNKMLTLAPASEKDKILAKIGRTYMVLGHNTISQGNYPEGLKNTLLSLKIQEQLGDKSEIAGVQFNLGHIYTLQHNYPEALKYLEASLEICKELGVKSDIAYTYGIIGWVYIQKGDYSEALKYCKTAAKLAEGIQNKLPLAEIYSSLGLIYNHKGNYEEALKYDFNALKLYQEAGIKQALPDMYNNIGLIYLKQKKYTDASWYFSKALSFSKTTGSIEYIKVSYENRATLDSAQGNYKNALQHYKLAAIYRDSLFNKENTKKIIQQQMQYNFDKKQDSLKQKHIISETKLKAQEKQKYFYWFGFGMLTLISIFVLLNFHNQRKINKLAEQSHVRQKAELKLQNQQVLLNERLRISSELHDEIGATLSGIAMYSHLAKEQIKTTQKTEVEKSLTVMQQSAGEMINKLNDIVWLVNSEQDTLQKLVERLEEYATNMAPIKNMGVKFIIPADIADINLPVEHRRNIYLFCKEAINNAVKYSGSNLLTVAVKKNDHQLEFSVGDNGKGFNPAFIKKGNGLDNMQQRADEIGAKFTLRSIEGEGSVVSMELKIT